MSGGLLHHEDEVKGTEPLGWTPITERKQAISRKDQCVCAEVGSVFEITKPRSANYLTQADVLRDVEKALLGIDGWRVSSAARKSFL